MFYFRGGNLCYRGNPREVTEFFLLSKIVHLNPFTLQTCEDSSTLVSQPFLIPTCVNYLRLTCCLIDNVWRRTTSWHKTVDYHTELLMHSCGMAGVV